MTDKDNHPPEDTIVKSNTEVIKILDEIPIGMLILNYAEKTILYSNKYFKSIPSAHTKIILENIYNHSAEYTNYQRILNISQEIEIKEEGKRYLYGFSIYQIDRITISAFASEIASKSTYAESRQKNVFYNELLELISEITHEIGNPIAGMKTGLQVLLHNISSWPQEKMENYIKRTLNEIDRLAVFLKRIRDVYNENPLEMKTINLKSHIDNVFRLNEEILKQKEIKFKNMVEENINILIDEVAFSQIIFNLLKNSLQILEPQKEIKIYVEDIDDFYIKLVYRNNGKPIPEKLLEKIFSPFFTTKDREGGIGLPISLKLLTRMGGTMKAAQPEDGKGAKFVIYIPNKIKK